MKYLIAIITGFFVGGLSHETNGYLLGGFIGYLLMQLSDLKLKINNLEIRLRNNQQKKRVEKAQSHLFNKNQDHRSNVDESIHEQMAKTKSVKDAIEDKTQAITTQPVSQNNNTKIETFELDREQIKRMSPELYTNELELNSAEKQHKQAAQHVVKSKIKQQIKPQITKTKPTPVDRVFLKLKSLIIGYFSEGNSMVRTGMLVLFIGVAFLLKYVAERTVVPIEFRYIGVTFASLLMLVLGWKLRHKRAGFALSLQGGGVGLLYLVLFAAMRLHNLLPAQMVLFLLIAVVMLSAILAILSDSKALAIIGMIGGFAAPILTSTGSGSHVQLFSYYLLLNIGVFAIAWFKSWRILNVIGFVATFGIGSLWGFKYYKPEFLLSVEPFLISYFLLYTFIAVLFALKQPPQLKGINDGTIIFGTPLIGFALQAGLMKDMEYGLAYSSLALGVFYVLFAYVIKRLNKAYMKDLIESFVALGIGFATLAIPLGFDGRVTSAMWVAEGSALLWVGIRQYRVFPRFSGYALTAFGMVAFFMENKADVQLIPWLNADYIGTLIITLAATFVGLYSRANSHKLLSVEERLIPTLMIVAAAFWWIYGGISEINIHYYNIRFLLMELFLSISSIVLLILANRIKFK
ncbi:MAG: DUF2339 domain-containing protein, partial [Alcanivoracaceae bacterium]|nr:DUF2339 domain-containing protein [Alcanivoracaceae bacterium]